MKKRIYLVENDRAVAKSLAEAIEELSNAQVIGFSTTESDACNGLRIMNFHGTSRWSTYILTKETGFMCFVVFGRPERRKWGC